MEKSIAIFVAINFVVTGLSHVFQHRAWAEFFAMLQAKGRPGAFVNGFLGLGMGSLIVAVHNVWTGIPAILTLIGWAYLVKSGLIFLFPDWNVRSMAKVQAASPLKFVIAGTGMIGIALMLIFAVSRGYSTS